MSVITHSRRNKSRLGLLTACDSDVVTAAGFSVVNGLYSYMSSITVATNLFEASSLGWSIISEDGGYHARLFEGQLSVLHVRFVSDSSQTRNYEAIWSTRHSTQGKPHRMVASRRGSIFIIDRFGSVVWSLRYAPFDRTLPDQGPPTLKVLNDGVLTLSGKYGTYWTSRDPITQPADSPMVMSSEAWRMSLGPGGVIRSWTADNTVYHQRVKDR